MSARKARYLVNLEFEGLIPSTSGPVTALQQVKSALDVNLHYISNHPENSVRKFTFRQALTERVRDNKLSFQSGDDTNSLYDGKLTFLALYELENGHWRLVKEQAIVEDENKSIFRKARDMVAKAASTLIHAPATLLALSSGSSSSDEDMVKQRQSLWPQEKWVEIKDVDVPFTLVVDKFDVLIDGRDQVFTVSFAGIITTGDHLVETVRIKSCQMIPVATQKELSKKERTVCKATTSCMLYRAV